MSERRGSRAELARLQQLVARQPGDLAARHNLGVELRRLGRPDAALVEIEQALKAGMRAPETALMRAHLLADAGRFDEAVTRYRQLLAVRPDLLDAQEALARLLPLLGRKNEALDNYRTALRQLPGNGLLWVSALAAAKDLGESATLLEWARAAERRFGRDTMIDVFAANALSALDRDRDALALLEQAVRGEPDYQGAHVALAHVLLRLGEPRRAEKAALAAARLDPRDQSAWALLSVIWRLLDDPREEWLADYERFVLPVNLAGLDLTQVAAVLDRLHQGSFAPAEQSVRGGTQTRGNLFDLDDPVIERVREAIRMAVQGAIAGLPHDADHPFLGRRRATVDFAASWSVRLRHEGFHVSHMHPKGWLSSACYIALPDGIDEAAGALTFGVPDAALKLDLPPRRVVVPRAGLLVLFPSYLWHGTLPFQSEQDRLTIAFDAVPVDSVPTRD